MNVICVNHPSYQQFTDSCTISRSALFSAVSSVPTSTTLRWNNHLHADNSLKRSKCHKMQGNACRRLKKNNDRRIMGRNPAMPPSGLSVGLVPSRQRFLPHKNGTHPSFCLFCLLSTSLNFRTHNK